MKGTLALEYIGANTGDMLRQIARLERAIGVKPDQDAPRFGPFVAELTRDEDGTVRHRYLYGKRDYSRANSKGSRGVYVWYILEQDRLYFVHERTSWRSSVDYYCTVNLDGSIYKLSEQEVMEWLSAL